MQFEANVTVHRCDNPTCRKQVVQLDKEVSPEGFSGTVTSNLPGNGGEFGGDWFACTQRCITKAIVAATTPGNGMRGEDQ